jgi:hypothetical protein
LCESCAGRALLHRRARITDYFKLASIFSSAREVGRRIAHGGLQTESAIAELVQQCFGVRQIGGVEPLGEPAINLGEHRARSFAAILSREQAGRRLVVARNSADFASVNSGISAIRIELSTWQFPELAKAIEDGFRACNES